LRRSRINSSQLVSEPGWTGAGCSHYGRRRFCDRKQRYTAEPDSSVGPRALHRLSLEIRLCRWIVLLRASLERPADRAESRTTQCGASIIAIVVESSGRHLCSSTATTRSVIKYSVADTFQPPRMWSVDAAGHNGTNASPRSANTSRLSVNAPTESR
jgi:hypothetical protein